MPTYHVKLVLSCSHLFYLKVFINCYIRFFNVKFTILHKIQLFKNPLGHGCLNSTNLQQVGFLSTAFAYSKIWPKAYSIL